MDNGSPCKCALIGNVSECLKRNPHGCYAGGNCQMQVREQLKRCCLISSWKIDPIAQQGLLDPGLYYPGGEMLGP